MNAKPVIETVTGGASSAATHLARNVELHDSRCLKTKWGEWDTIAKFTCPHMRMLLVVNIDILQGLKRHCQDIAACCKSRLLPTKEPHSSGNLQKYVSLAK